MRKEFNKKKSTNKYLKKKKQIFLNQKKLCHIFLEVAHFQKIPYFHWA